MSNQTISDNSKVSGQSIDEVIARWTAVAGSDPELAAICKLLQFLSDEIYCDYEPYADWPIFWERLGSWIQNVEGEADQQTLFRLVPWLLFFGKEEMKAMYRAAFAGPIARWIIDQAELSLENPQLRQQFDIAVGETWFGSLAGMDLGSFMRLNGISEQALRPEFRVLSHLGDVGKLRDYLNGNEQRPNRYRRIVVVEDFVGTGRQMNDAVRILEELEKIPVLICPIIAANEGCKKGEGIQVRTNNRITFAAHFQIPDAATLVPEATPENEPAVFSSTRELVDRTWDRLKLTAHYDLPLGIGNLGLLVLTYLNCPNNVPPFIHRMTDASDSNCGWYPLFPRVVRES